MDARIEEYYRLPGEPVCARLARFHPCRCLSSYFKRPETQRRFYSERLAGREVLALRSNASA
jgi:hypothetical protein